MLHKPTNRVKARRDPFIVQQCFLCKSLVQTDPTSYIFHQYRSLSCTDGEIRS